MHLTCGKTVPEVGLEPSSGPCKYEGTPENISNTPQSGRCSAQSKPKVWTLSTPFFLPQSSSEADITRAFPCDETSVIGVNDRGRIAPELLDESVIGPKTQVFRDIRPSRHQAGHETRSVAHQPKLPQFQIIMPAPLGHHGQ